LSLRSRKIKVRTVLGLITTTSERKRRVVSAVMIVEIKVKHLSFFGLKTRPTRPPTQEKKKEPQVKEKEAITSSKLLTRARNWG